jgi:hypothetical protein
MVMNELPTDHLSSYPMGKPTFPDNIEAKIRMKASAQVPCSISLKVALGLERYLGLVGIGFSFIIFIVSLFRVNSWTVLNWLVILSPLICAGLVYFVLDRIFSKQELERISKVNLKFTTLSEEIKHEIEAQAEFYKNIEWLEVRECVINEEERICTKCNRYICDDEDFIVTHKYPKYEHPELALERGNLQILCRICNSKKIEKGWLEDYLNQ